MMASRLCCGTSSGSSLGLRGSGGLQCRASAASSYAPSARMASTRAPSSLTASLGWRCPSPSLRRVRDGGAVASPRRTGRTAISVLPLAMVNVDFASPSLALGAALIGCGVLLLQIRNMQSNISRDADIVVAAMVSIVGSTLIFQGWRLDPLLLLCQALTTSVAIWYGLEAFRLRSKAVADDGGIAGALAPPAEEPVDYRSQQFGGGSQAQGGQGGVDPYFRPWAGMGGDAGGGAPSSARWGLPPPDTTSAGASFGDTLRYDYYGNAIEPLQQQGPSSYYGGPDGTQQQGQHYDGAGPAPGEGYGQHQGYGAAGQYSDGGVGGGEYGGSQGTEHQASAGAGPYSDEYGAGGGGYGGAGPYGAVGYEQQGFDEQGYGGQAEGRYSGGTGGGAGEGGGAAPQQQQQQSDSSSSGGSKGGVKSTRFESVDDWE
ncbi:hypothetical protein FOA52_008069 [Chlamydomonas sp. UWO 241]|nr:hypothetical protein FOA52_008069 [Chlamydomonas sp. UWO 241]